MSLRFPTFTVTLLALTLGAFVLAPLTDAALTNNGADWFWQGVLDQQQPLAVWRLVSAHLLHTDWNHLLWNLLALGLLATIVEQRSRMLLLITLVLGIAFVDLWFFSASPTRYYCGWSGVLLSLIHI